MADGNLLHQPSNRSGELGFSAVSSEIPLLPYEKQLIKTIGCSEGEYRYFVSEAVKKAKVRPAGYEHIPDVRNDATVYAVISLVIGVLSTAASFLLPKPKPPKAADPTTSKKLGSVTGASRFVSTFGFDTVAELATFGEVIPVVFGLYNKTYRVGGILVSPKLVWSRMFSYGRQQAAQLHFVVGEQGKTVNGFAEGIKPPELSGIFVGNNALDAVLSEYFDFYWKRGTYSDDYYRIRQRNKLYGSADVLSDTLPTGTLDEVFVTPTQDGDNDVAFCSSYSPVNNTEFGVYSPIPNGTFYRVTWRVISRPDGNDKDGRLNAERHKIAGYLGAPYGGSLLEDGEVSDMAGTGRNYSCRMGIVDIVGKPNDQTQIDDPYKTLHDVQIGSIITFAISASTVDTYLYQEKASVDEINSTIENLQIAADEALQIGEIFAIGATLWKVTSRSAEQFDIDRKQSQFVRLVCIDVDDSRHRKLGTVTHGLVVEPGQGFVSDFDSAVGIAWFPLTKYAKGLVRNNRPCDTTEIGIASTVFQQLNGLANFPSLPSAKELKKTDDDNVNVTSGTISGHVTRASFFTFHIRPAGVDGAGAEFGFVPSNIYIVVTGNKPITQYNQLRFRHPSGEPREYEYKFVPVPASELRSLEIELTGQTPVIHLDASAGLYSRRFTAGAHGDFTLEVKGVIRALDTFKSNVEFISRRREEIITTTTEDQVNVVSPKVRFEYVDAVYEEIIEGELDDIYPEGPLGNYQIADSAEIEGTAYGTPNDNCWGKQGAFTSSIFGRADLSRIPRNSTTSMDVIERDPLKDRWVKLRYTAKKIQNDADHFTRERNGQTYGWNMESVSVQSSSKGWNRQDSLTVQRGAGATGKGSSFNTADNAYYYNRGPGNSCQDLQNAGFTVRIASTKSQSHASGDNQGYYFHLFGDPDSLNVGAIYTAFITAYNADSAINNPYTIELKAIVVAAPSSYYFRDSFGGGVHLWQTHSTKITNDYGVSVQIKFLYHAIQPQSDNLRAIDYYREGVRVIARYKIKSVNTELVSPGFESTIIEEPGSTTTIPGETTTTVNVLSAGLVFEGQSQWAEQSFYRGSVSKSCDNEPEHRITYVNESLRTKQPPEYPRMATAGLSLRASRSFSRLDQLRCWLPAGITCQRLHPDLGTYEDPENGAHIDGASNLFTDLVFFLLTNLVAGAGSATNMSAASPNLIDVESFTNTSKFLHQNKLFCNGAITDKVNIQDFVATNASSFLCNFAIKNGKFGLVPVVPTTKSGAISVAPVEIKQMFTDGNILEDTFELEYLEAEERKPFKANMRYRLERENKLPEERVVTVDYKEYGEAFRDIETFDLTQFCTSKEHAELVARYYLLVRDFVTHSVRFSTTASGLDLAPGDFVKIETAVTPYSSALNGTIASDGTITSVTYLADGNYDILYYAVLGESVASGNMQVSNGRATDPTFYGSVFTLQQKISSQNVYQVEQLSFNEDMTVAVVASEYVCTEEGVSKIALALTDDSLFNVSTNN